MRLSWTKNTGAKKPRATTVTVHRGGVGDITLAALLKVAKSKFRVPLRRARLFVARDPTGRTATGTELLASMDPATLRGLLADGLMLAVSDGSDWVHPGGIAGGATAKRLAAAAAGLPLPPRYPFPGHFDGSRAAAAAEPAAVLLPPAEEQLSTRAPPPQTSNGTAGTTANADAASSAATGDGGPPLAPLPRLDAGPGDTGELLSGSPILRGNVLAAIRGAIAGHPRIREFPQPNGIISFDYADLPAFPDPAGSGISPAERFVRHAAHPPSSPVTCHRHPLRVTRHQKG